TAASITQTECAVNARRAHGWQPGVPPSRITTLLRTGDGRGHSRFPPIVAQERRGDVLRGGIPGEGEGDADRGGGQVVAAAVVCGAAPAAAQGHHVERGEA